MKIGRIRSLAGAVTLLWLLLVLAVSAEDDISGPVVPMGGIGVSGQKNATKKETMADKVEDILKQEFQDDVEEAEQDKGKTFNQTAEKSDVSVFLEILPPAGISRTPRSFTSPWLALNAKIPQRTVSVRSPYVLLYAALSLSAAHTPTTGGLIHSGQR